MKKRLLSALAIVPAILAAILCLPSGFMLIFLLVISTLALLEFYRLLDRSNIPVFRYVGAFFGILLLVAVYFGFRMHDGGHLVLGESAGAPRAARWGNIVLVCAVLTIMVRQFPQKEDDHPIATIACTLFGLLYVPFLLSFFIRLALSWDDIGWWTPLGGTVGGMLVLHVVMVAKLTDAGAFFVGRRFGRHKLFPRLSPAKTWEGFVGGTAIGTLSGCLFLPIVLPGGSGILERVAVLSLLVSLAATVGDLAESLLKRGACAKDSGTLVPGIGGLLDIFDSMMFALPVAYIYLNLDRSILPVLMARY